MNFNTLLLRLGFKPDDFFDVPVEPILLMEALFLRLS